MYHVVDVVNCFVKYYILLTHYSQQTAYLVKQQNDTNIIWQKHTSNHFATSTTWYMI